MRRLVFALLLFPLLAPAAGITDIGITDASSPNGSAATPGRFLEFRTASSAPASAALDPVSGIASFDARMAWMLAMRLTSPPVDGTDVSAAYVAFDITFTVDDPFSQGYFLQLDWLTRGYLTAEWTGVGPGSFVDARGTFFQVQFDDDLNDATAPQPVGSTADAGANATQSIPFQNSLTQTQGGSTTAPYFGTRTFLVRFTSSTPNLLVRFVNGPTGEANGRFGLDPLTGNFLRANYPGPDGEPAGDHGLFFGVDAQFLNLGGGTEVPEPSAFGLAGVALCAFGWQRRRGRYNRQE